MSRSHAELDEAFLLAVELDDARDERLARAGHTQWAGVEQRAA
jgi:hypothetical protein